MQGVSEVAFGAENLKKLTATLAYKPHGFLKILSRLRNSFVIDAD